MHTQVVRAQNDQGETTKTQLVCVRPAVTVDGSSVSSKCGDPSKRVIYPFLSFFVAMWILEVIFDFLPEIGVF